MLSEKQKQNHPYHHGNVKEALISVAMRLMEDGQVSLISLRRLSKEVGVTPSAVYNHFSDKDALMLAIKTRVYEEFNQFFEERISDSNDPEESLLEMCLAYYHFSKEHPSRFQFLFSSVLPMEWSTPETVEVFCRCLVRTRKLVLGIYKKYQIPCSEEALVNTTLLVWSQLHGIVALRNSGSIQAAVAYQNWPSSCALIHDHEVERLIKSHRDNVVNGILNYQRSESHH